MAVVSPGPGRFISTNAQAVGWPKKYVEHDAIEAATHYDNLAGQTLEAREDLGGAALDEFLEEHGAEGLALIGGAVTARAAAIQGQNIGQVAINKLFRRYAAYLPDQNSKNRTEAEGYIYNLGLMRNALVNKFGPGPSYTDAQLDAMFWEVARSGELMFRPGAPELPPDEDLDDVSTEELLRRAEYEQVSPWAHRGGVR